MVKTPGAGVLDAAVDLGREPASALESEQHRVLWQDPVHLAPSCLSWT